jgi:hypothetical protein
MDIIPVCIELNGRNGPWEAKIVQARDKQVIRINNSDLRTFDCRIENIENGLLALTCTSDDPGIPSKLAFFTILFDYAREYWIIRIDLIN